MNAFTIQIPIVLLHGAVGSADEIIMVAVGLVVATVVFLLVGRSDKGGGKGKGDKP